MSIAYAMSFQTGKRCNDANALLAQTLSWIELHMNSHFKFLRGAVQWYKCPRFGNIKRNDAENCVSMNSSFKVLSDAMIQFHTNAFAFVRKKQYKHRIIGHAKHTYPQIWNVLRFVSNRNQFHVHLKLLCNFMCIRFNKFMILMSKRYVNAKLNFHNFRTVKF